MHAINVGKWDISREIKYDGVKPTDSQQEEEGTFDSYDPVVGKWMTNLVATTPITAKAMKILYAELNRQLQQLLILLPQLHALVTSSKTTPNVQITKTSLVGQQKKIPDRGKAKPISKTKKNPIKTNNLIQHQVLLLIYIVN